MSQINANIAHYTNQPYWYRLWRKTLSCPQHSSYNDSPKVEMFLPQEKQIQQYKTKYKQSKKQLVQEAIM